mmetsp:Transcript_728/g.1991  ORF Transcript_728/g.1991 Transcript_728/m.1991 type:complete len:392 (-) Transcript_728:462-1637(-)
MGASQDDADGKGKISVVQAHQRHLIHWMLMGLCVGMIVAERLYVSHSRAEHENGSFGGVPAGSSRREVMMGEVRREIGEVRRAAQKAAHAIARKRQPRNDLEATLMRVAPDREVLAAVSNKNYLWGSPPMLKTFTDGFKRAGVSNHLILALDKDTFNWCEENNINVHLLKLELHKAQADTGENHAVSAMKFGILRQFLDLGWSVLLSDIDIAILQNPFEHLYRDSDVEGMTDGFDERTAYGSIEGYEDASMGWARFAQMYQHFNLNSGLFYLSANARTQDLMRRLDERLSKTKYWDQTAFNEEVFFLSHGKYKSPQVTVRVMEIDEFMNSKRLFKDIRHRPKEEQPPMPVTVHINYHPDKHERMLAVVKYYVDGDQHALDAFPGGSEAGSK